MTSVSCRHQHCFWNQRCFWIVAKEGGFARAAERLGMVVQTITELALHHLDLMLAGQLAPSNPNLRLSSERLAS